jgi:hypothetical protein
MSELLVFAAILAPTALDDGPKTAGVEGSDRVCGSVTTVGDLRVDGSMVERAKSSVGLSLVAGVRPLAVTACPTREREPR